MPLEGFWILLLPGEAPGEGELTSFLISGFPSVLTIIFCIKYGTLPERWLLETSNILRLGRDVSSFGKVPESVLFERINCSIDVSIEKSEEMVPWSSKFWKLTTLVFLTSLHKINRRRRRNNTCQLITCQGQIFQSRKCRQIRQVACKMITFKP